MGILLGNGAKPDHAESRVLPVFKSGGIGFARRRNVGVDKAILVYFAALSL
jgi:hypothetical protein